MNGKRYTSGFTLIELIVVAVITAVLATVAIVSYSSTTKKARDSKRQADVEQIRSALEMYRADNSSYPIKAGVACGYTVLYQELKEKGFIDKIPMDPTRSACADSFPDYYYSSNGSTYEVCAKLEQSLANPACNCSVGAYNYCTMNP